ncbi:MAG: FecR domain-containing protein [Gammaproteobacteria bacterium]|nr:FecR domain-containing protein [Gammaproteobacteria bacterium]
MTLLRRMLCAAVLIFAALPQLAAAADAGSVTMLVGRGTALSPDGNVRALQKGDPVFTGELVNTGTNSFLNLKFSDGGLVTLRPNSRFEISDYRYDGGGAANAPATPAAATSATPPQASTGRAFFRLLKGGFRAVTGLIGKSDRNDYAAVTPVATIGIRGTDYLAVLCDLACQADPVVRGDLPEGASAAGASIFGVIEGRILLTTPQGDTQELGADEYAIVLADGRIVLLSQQPRFLRVDPIPNPESCVE